MTVTKKFPTDRSKPSRLKRVNSLKQQIEHASSTCPSENLISIYDFFNTCNADFHFDKRAFLTETLSISRVTSMLGICSTPMLGICYLQCI